MRTAQQLRAALQDLEVKMIVSWADMTAEAGPALPALAQTLVPDPQPFDAGALMFGQDYLRSARLRALMGPAWVERFLAPMRGREAQYSAASAISTLLEVQMGVYTDEEAHDYLRPGEHDAAMTTVASLAHPSLRDPRASAALCELANARGISAKTLLQHELFPESVLLVLGSVEIPRRLQLGQHRVKDASGRWTAIRPTLLPFTAFVPWVRQELYHATEAILLDEGYPRHRLDPLDRAGGLSSTMSDTRVSMEDALEQSRQLARLEAEATPQQRLLLALLLQGLSREEAAGAMRISRATVDWHWHQLTRKASTL